MVEPLLFSATCAGGAAALARGALSSTSNLFGPVLTRGPNSNALYLTFEDGPNIWMTPQILAILRQYRVPATFFLLGRHVDRFPNLAWGVADAGHSVANHSHTHPAPLLAGKRRLSRDLLRSHRTIYHTTGVWPRFIRPPFGHHPPSIHLIARRLGCQVATWQVDAEDHGGRTSEEIRNQVLSHLKPGAIIRLRDGHPDDPFSDHSPMIAALPQIIAEARQAGYSFSALA
ncbi:MAG: polysaccharide deacetylase family protein [Gemmatimonadota bacterium]